MNFLLQRNRESGRKKSRRNSNSNSVSSTSQEEGDKSCSQESQVLMKDFDLDQLGKMRQKSEATTITASSLRSSLTSESSMGDGRQNIWSSIARNRSMASSSSTRSGPTDSHYDDLDNDDRNGKRKQFSICRTLYFNCKCLKAFFFECGNNLQMLRKHPYIVMWTLLFFAATCSVSVFTIYTVCKWIIDQQKNTSTLAALEMVEWFADAFTKALLPLFSMEQTLLYCPMLNPLANKIGKVDEEGAAEVISGPMGYQSHRNITGICDNSADLDMFKEHIALLERSFHTKGVVVQYRIAPNGVFCMDYPESLPVPPHHDDDISNRILSSPSHMDQVIGRQGWDVLNAPTPYWQKTLKSMYCNEYLDPEDDEIARHLSRIYVTHHPPPQHQKQESSIFNPHHTQHVRSNPHEDHKIKTKNHPGLFHAHLPIIGERHNLTVNGENFQSWGFAMSIINMTELVVLSNIAQKFEEQGLEYVLTRTDKRSPDDPFPISSSSESYHHTHEHQTITVKETTSDSIWECEASYSTYGHGLYFNLSYAIAVLICFLCSIMFGLVLLERRMNKTLLYKVMPASAIEKLQRGQTVVERYDLVTIFFLDIVGFTSLAGSLSALEVMEILNELYSEMDKLVEKHGIYKVETIGDAYMVVGGAPDRISPSRGAEKVALFALDVIEFVRKFIPSDGTSISVRIGLASGPVVAGVVGTAMPRYCFFGDTVNLASRMESTSVKMMIQCTDLTHQLLLESANYVFIFHERIEGGIKGINVKGKGLTHTWWIDSAFKIDGLNYADIEANKAQLMYNGEIVTSSYHGPDQSSRIFDALTSQDWRNLGRDANVLAQATSNRSIMIDRLVSILEHRLWLTISQRRAQGPLSDSARSQLKAYVVEIESYYNQVDFHNFEHISHVAISMNKLIESALEQSSGTKRFRQNAFIHFILVYSALVHDVGHLGMSNNMLTSINHEMTMEYDGPIAERNSIHLAVDLLFQEKYKNLQRAIFPNIHYRIEFTRALYWAILGTDIASADRVQMCKERFDITHAALERPPSRGDKSISHDYDFDTLCPFRPYIKDVLRALDLTPVQFEKYREEFIWGSGDLATCVTLEHMIQVSDVAHTMQEWENFIKWNFRLYSELMDCHSKDLMPDPSYNWDDGQVAFLDTYVIPLAERMERCFGVTSPIPLVKYAKKNKQRWESEGKRISRLFIDGIKKNEAEELVLQKCFAQK